MKRKRQSFRLMYRVNTCNSLDIIKKIILCNWSGPHLVLVDVKADLAWEESICLKTAASNMV